MELAHAINVRIKYIRAYSGVEAGNLHGLDHVMAGIKIQIRSKMRKTEQLRKFLPI